MKKKENSIYGEKTFGFFPLFSLIPSSMGHVESRVNQRGPPRKAKYSWVTDSEIVLRRKGEKNPRIGSEIEHETVC